jgi:hypothetical protein
VTVLLSREYRSAGGRDRLLGARHHATGRASLVDSSTMATTVDEYLQLTDIEARGQWKAIATDGHRAALDGWERCLSGQRSKA